MPPKAALPSLVAAHPDVRPLLAGRTGAQRARVLEAMVQAVAEKGYAAATVADAVRIGRVSRGTFYALFDSKEACFLESYRLGFDVLDQRVGEAVAAEPGGWRARLRAGLRAYLGTLAHEPRFARSHLLEVHSAGPHALVARDESLRRFAERYKASFAAGRREEPGTHMPSDDACFVLSAGSDQLICSRVREGAFDALPRLEEPIFTTAIALFCGTTHEGA